MITIYLLILGIVIGIVFYGYTKTLRPRHRGEWETDPSSSGMTSGPVNQTRAQGGGAKIIPLNVRTGSDDEPDSCPS